MIWKVQRVDEKIIFKQFLKITFFRTAQRRFFSVTPTEDAAFFQGESLGSPTKSHFTSIHPVSARAIFSRANRSTFSHALKFERARKKAERRCFLCTRPKVLLRRLWWRNEISIDRKVDHLSPQKIDPSMHASFLSRVFRFWTWQGPSPASKTALFLFHLFRGHFLLPEIAVRAKLKVF